MLLIICEAVQCYITLIFIWRLSYIFMYVFLFVQTVQKSAKPFVLDKVIVLLCDKLYRIYNPECCKELEPIECYVGSYLAITDLRQFVCPAISAVCQTPALLLISWLILPYKCHMVLILVAFSWYRGRAHSRHRWQLSSAFFVFYLYELFNINVIWIWLLSMFWTLLWVNPRDLYVRSSPSPSFIELLKHKKQLSTTKLCLPE